MNLLKANSSKFGNKARSCRLLTAGAILIYLFAQQVHAASALNQGQEAFQAGNYLQAVEHFRVAMQDSSPGKGTAAYNLGVAAYKAGDYVTAEEAFLVASTDANFAVTSFYNLGLVDRRRGRFGDARIWFKQVARHPNATNRLKRLAEKAAASLPEPVTSATRLMRPQREPERPDLFYADLTTGYGSDSNVYRSPSAAYVDRSDPAAPTVDPVQISSAYIPVDAVLAARWETAHDGFFRARYKFEGRFYQDEEASNADEELHQLSFGGIVDRKTRRGSLYWSGRFDVERVKQVAYDRDTGDVQIANTQDVGDRFNYTKAGPRIYYDREWKRFGWGFKGSGYIRNYDETLDYLNLSHEQYSAGLHFSYRPLERTQVRLSAGGYQRTYLSRVAKDINGVRFSDNDDLEYEYVYGGLSIRQRLTGRLRLSLDARYTERTDLFEGYADYERTTARVSLRYRHPRFKVYAAYTQNSYDYPNAFAFDDPTFELLTYDTSYASLEAEVRITRQLSLDLKYDMDVVESNDARSEYDRSLASLAVRWRF